jgi:Flp pilus assembly protein TadB
MNINISIIFEDPIIIILLPLAIISIVLYFAIYQRRKRLKKIENALPEMLSELTESLKSGTAMETALKEISETRKDALGDEVKILIKDMKEYSFSESLTRFAKRTNSKTVSRIVSIINISMTTNAELTEVMKRISEELWSGYMLDVERETKAKSYASMIQFGGLLLTPGIISFILSLFGSGIEMGELISSIGLFVLGFAALASIMHGVAMRRLKESIMLVPPSMFIAYTLYTVVSTSTLM